MKFNPGKYNIKDERMKPFIDADEIWNFVKETKDPTRDEVRAIIE